MRPLSEMVAPANSNDPIGTFKVGTILLNPRTGVTMVVVAVRADGDMFLQPEHASGWQFAFHSLLRPSDPASAYRPIGFSYAVAREID